MGQILRTVLVIEPILVTNPKYLNFIFQDEKTDQSSPDLRALQVFINLLNSATLVNRFPGT